MLFEEEFEEAVAAIKSAAPSRLSAKLEALRVCDRWSDCCGLLGGILAT